MARSINRVILKGNLTADPQQKTTQNGTAVVTFAVATNRNYVDSAGEKQDTADFHNIVAFGKLAEICANLLKVGSKVFIEGRLQTRKWEGTDGKTNYRTEIVLEDMDLLANGRARAESDMNADEDYVSASTPNASTKSDGTATKKPNVDSGDEINLDDIPF